MPHYNKAIYIPKMKFLKPNTVAEFVSSGTVCWNGLSSPTCQRSELLPEGRILGLEAYTIWTFSVRKEKYKITNTKLDRYKRRVLFGMRNKITTNYAYQKTGKWHKYHIIQRKKT